MNDHQQEFFIPGLELICLTSDDDEKTYADQEPMIDWLDDCEAQENLFQIIPLTPEETCCDKDNHIIQHQPISLFFEELGVFCDEPEPIDPSRDYEAEYKLYTTQLEQMHSLHKRPRRQHHVHLDSNSAPSPPLDAFPPPGLSSSSSSFHHTDDDHYDDDDHKSSHSRLSHFHSQHKHFYPSTISKPSHFTFSSDRL